MHPQDMVELPGMLPPLKMKDDTDNCTMVLIFPRSKDVGGVVDPEAIVEDPWAKLGKIFVATANTHSAVTLDRLKSIIGPEAVSMERYQMPGRSCKHWFALSLSYCIPSATETIIYVVS